MFENKIYYFQEKSNEVLDLQDIFSLEEIGIYFILKAAYFKYAGNLREESLLQKCKFFGDKNKLFLVRDKIFKIKDGILENKNWDQEIKEIKEKSSKRKSAALARWKKDSLKDKKTDKSENKPMGFNSVNLDNNLDKSTLNEIKLNENKLIIDNNFEEFWQYYTPVCDKNGTYTPKGSKSEAKKSYEKAIKKFNHLEIMKALRLYLTERKKNAGYTKHAVAWLNQSMKDEFICDEDITILAEPQQNKLTKDQLQDQINKEFIKLYNNQ